MEPLLIFESGYGQLCLNCELSNFLDPLEIKKDFNNHQFKMYWDTL